MVFSPARYLLRKGALFQGIGIGEKNHKKFRTGYTHPPLLHMAAAIIAFRKTGIIYG